MATILHADPSIPVAKIKPIWQRFKHSEIAAVIDCKDEDLGSLSLNDGRVMWVNTESEVVNQSASVIAHCLEGLEPEYKVCGDALLCELGESPE